MTEFKGYKITSPYGKRTRPFPPYDVEFHKGVDLVLSHRAPIKAFTGGEVIHAEFGQKGTGFGGYGNVVFIKDIKGNGQLYAHLDETHVKVGQAVKKGQVIGLQGSTGLSTGSHLHYEIRLGCVYGKTVDPIEYLEQFELKHKVNEEVGEIMQLVMSASDKEQTKQNISYLAKKGYINSPDLWLKRVDDGTIYESMPFLMTQLFKRLVG